MTYRIPALLAAVIVLGACAGGGAPTTVQDPSPTTSGTAPTSAPPAEAEDGFAVYFLQDSGGTEARVPPFLVAVHRGTADENLPVAAVQALIAGPTAAEEDDGISVDMPEGTVLHGLSIVEGVATVDLSGEFEAGGGSFAMFSRLATLTYTLTQFDDVESVVLELDGVPVEVFSSEGIVIDGPLTRDDYVDLLPGILVEEPAYGAPVGSTFTVSGTAAAFEGVFQLEVLGEDGGHLAGPPWVQTDEGMGWGAFEVTVDVPVGGPADLTIHVWEESAKDGSTISERFIPVRVVP